MGPVVAPPSDEEGPGRRVQNIAERDEKTFGKCRVYRAIPVIRRAPSRPVYAETK